MTERFLRRANERIDPASLIAFRVLFGAVMVFSAIRFLLNGWVDLFFAKPGFHFAFWGFEFVRPVSPALMTAAVVALGVLGALIALGVAWRVVTVAFFVLFTWLELTDVTNYLNHYYLCSLIALLFCFLPLGQKRPVARRWMLWLLRFQVGLVYLGAALAKANPDWLVHGQPLGIWLAARTDVPLVGWFLGSHAVALVFSWAGFLYDLLIVPALLWKRTRPFAFVVLLGFHTTTGLLFEIGMFPLIMTTAATIFFAEDWPTRFLRFPPVRLPAAPVGRLTRVGAIVIAGWMGFHVAMPLRFLAYQGPVNWHEQGMRFAWKVMVRDKAGAVTFRVTIPGETREREVPPSRYLTDRQEREMAGQPDLILQLAHHIAADFETRHPGPVEVRADALVSWNGRPAARLVDPNVDLARVADGLAPARWILPAPTTAPVRLKTAGRLATTR